MNNRIELKVIYTWMVCLYPILHLYNSILPSITMIEMIAITFFLFALSINRNIALEKKTTILFLWLLGQSVLQAIEYQGAELVSILGSAGRYAMQLAFMAILTQEYFDREYGVKCVVRIAIASTIYLIIQEVLALSVGILLPGGLPYLPTWHPNMRTYINDVVRYGITYRPRSIFGEPAHYCQYIALALVIVLFRKEKNWLKVASVLSLGVIVSMSAIGILTIGVIWTIWLIDEQISKKRGMISKYLIMSIIMLPAICYLLNNIPFIQSVVQKKLLRSGGILADDRFVRIGAAIEELQGLREMFFGKGLVDNIGFLPSYVAWLYSFGIFGFSILIGYLFLAWKNNDSLGRRIVFVFLFECFGSELLLGNFFYLYFSFVLSKRQVEH